MTAESLEGMDSVFVTLDTPNAPLHVGMVLELVPTSDTTVDPKKRFDEIKLQIESRLGRIDVLRRRIVRVPFDLGSPIAVEDPDFDFGSHVVRRAVTSPGGPKELEALVARIMARPLAPDRPMWEISVIEGLESGRTGVLAKIHHALADGVSGVSVFAELFDLEQQPSTEIVAIEAEIVPPIPTPLEMLARSSSEVLRRPAAILEAMGTTLEHVAGRVDSVFAEIATAAPTLLAAPKTSLSGTVSHGRNFERVCLSLPAVKEVSKECGGTVTDFALTIVGGAARRLLEHRGESLDKELIAFIPVNIRAPGTEGELGNKISARLAPLATLIEDPHERLATLVARSKVIKEGGVSQNDFLSEVANAVGPAMASAAGKVIDAFGLFEMLPNVANLVLSSVPGPPVPLWCSGQQIVRASPMGPLMFNQALNITLLGYCDSLEFGILGCSKKVPDAALLRELVEDEATLLVGKKSAHFRASTA
jgi:WS/DGAT/MGAT family acyltransferase